MSIKFQCEHCRKQVNAPDAAAGKRGKCPYCGQSSYIPMPVSEDDLIPLAPLDEDDERRREAMVHDLFEMEQDLLAERKDTASTAPPLEHRPDLSQEELHHFVVNYCLDIFSGKVEGADIQARQLRKFGKVGVQAVDDFITGAILEPVLDGIPSGLLNGFLKQLRKDVSS
jgi:hypothetical protein